MCLHNFYQFSMVIPTDVLGMCLIFFPCMNFGYAEKYKYPVPLSPPDNIRRQTEIILSWFFLIDSEPYEADG